jgi:hypothetical protein
MSSDFDKSQLDLVHEININRERVNAAGEGARRLYLECDRLKHEQRGQAELYARALRERNDLEAQLKTATLLTNRTAALEAELTAVRFDRGQVQADAFQAARVRDQLADAILSGATRKALRDLVNRFEHARNL